MSEVDPLEERKIPDDEPAKTPDDTLRLTDDGIEMPEFLKGYIGDFTIRTPNTTGELETSDAGMPETEFYDGIIAMMPEAGDFNHDLQAGMMGISTDQHGEVVYEIVDEREDADR